MKDNMPAQKTGMIRLLRADEIECRVSTANASGIRLLLFKDARVDQRILDEAFTPFGWKRSHQTIDGSLYCTVEVWDDEKNQWIGKQDIGTPGNYEKEKGQASDAFKRACFNWGIGRELYTAPPIWIPASRVKIEKKDNSYTTWDRFHVGSIEYNGRREICGLSIVNQDGSRVFQMPSALQEAPISGMADIPEELQRELERTGILMEKVLERYGIQDFGQMTQDMYKKALNGLKKTKTKSAA